MLHTLSSECPLANQPEPKAATSAGSSDVCCCCCRCGSYARALQYFESYVRDKHGGGLNPSAFNGGCSSYNYDDVSFVELQF